MLTVRYHWGACRKDPTCCVCVPGNQCKNSRENTWWIPRKWFVMLYWHTDTYRYQEHSFKAGWWASACPMMCLDPHWIQAPPLLRYWTNPHVVLGILSNAKWAVAQCHRKIGCPQGELNSPKSQKYEVCFWHGEILCSMSVSYSPLQHDLPKLVPAFWSLKQHTWLLNQVSCCPCHCSAVRSEHHTCASASDGHVLMVPSRKEGSSGKLILWSPLKHHCLWRQYSKDII